MAARVGGDGVRDSSARSCAAAAAGREPELVEALPPTLLAVDLGLRTGFATYSEAGLLLTYGSHHYGSAAALRRAIPSLLRGISHVVVEGGGALARIWTDEANARGLDVRTVSAEGWRGVFLYPREQRSAEVAKRTADELARRVIEWSGARRPTSLRHDAAEAILVGLWGVLELGWLASLPAGLVHPPATAAASGRRSAPPGR